MTCSDVLNLAPLFLSGELDAARLEEFRTHLEGCHVCSEEMSLQARTDQRLRAEVLAQPTDSEGLEQRIRRSMAVRRWLPGIAAGIAAALVAGFLWSLVWTDVRVGRVYADAALDHHREVVDRQPRTWVSDRSALEALAARQGLLPVAVARLSRAGYSLERGKLCRLDGRVYLHMVYTRGGHEFSVFLRQRGEPFPASIRESDRGAEHVASFQTDLMAGMVVSDRSGEDARQLAHVASALL